jgi:hypothetical protein
MHEAGLIPLELSAHHLVGEDRGAAGHWPRALLQAAKRIEWAPLTARSLLEPSTGAWDADHRGRMM